MVTLNTNDLAHILAQIQLSEEHTRLINEGMDPGAALAQLLSSPLVPYGLRTVDGSFNNFQPGMERFGASDEVMVRLLTPNYADAEINQRTGQPTSYQQADGSVYDSQPRTVSNLVADQTLNNPAAIAAALAVNGVTGAEQLAAVQTVLTAFREAQAARAAATAAGPADPAAVAAANAALADAQAAVDAALTALADAVGQKNVTDAALAAAISRLDAANAALLAEDPNAGSVIDALAAVASAQALLDAAQNDADAAQADLDTAIAELEAREATLDAALASLTAAQALVANIAARITAAEIVLADAEAALAALPVSADVALAQAAVDTAEADLSAAQADAALAAITLSDAEAAVAAAEADVAAATAAADAAQATKDAADADAVAAQDALDAATVDLAAAVAASNAAFADLGAAVAGGDLAVILAASAAYQAALEEQQSAQTAHDAAVAADAEAEANAVAAADALTAAQATLADREADLAQAELDLAAAQAAHDAALADIATAEGVLADAEAALADAIAADTAVTEAVAARDAAAAALASLQAAAGVAADLVTEQTDVVSAAQAEVAVAEQAVTDAQAALDADQAALADAQAALADAEAALEAAGALGDAVTEVAEAQAEFDAAQAAAQAADQAVADASGELDAANAALATATTDATEADAPAAAEAAAALAEAALGVVLEEHGIELEGDSVFIRNVATDLGSSASFNGFMTIFGQFFDHGLDLTNKGGNGNVIIPLNPDDPLYVEGSPTNFMVLTRATNDPGADGILGTADDVRDHNNQTTPWVDLNQVYTSNPSHQVFLREYVMVDGRPMATGKMLEGAAGGPPTWADVKAQAFNMLGIELHDLNVHSVPLLVTDLYGEFVRGANGLPQMMTASGPVEGDLDDPISGLDALSAARGFIDDIAHNAVPKGPVDHDRNPATPMVEVTADADDVIGNPIIPNMFGIATEYDDELLDAHYIVGDGRGNENIALTSIHTMFHGEHNRQIDAIIEHLTSPAEGTGVVDIDFLNNWLLVPITTLPADLSSLVWDGERLFQAARFSTEMVYQHLVFEEFARTITPSVDPFVFSHSAQVDGAIFEEFAQVVYRFGHSMLNETVNLLHATENGATMEEIELLDAFLNPIAFAEAGVDAEAAAGAILRGMTRLAGNEIDEFMTEALRNNLLGLPLDLAALNMARARETGIPSLNEARRQFYEQTNDTLLKPYESWTDFAANLKNPLSIVNFIAAYGTHEDIVNATTLADKRDAAWALVFGTEGETAAERAARLDYVNGTGDWAGVETGLNHVDFWIGGLAEALMAFGSMLGSTFSFVFEMQLQNLQAGDRFYYLSRTQGMNLLTELEADGFAELMRRTTDTEHVGLHVPGAAFTTADYVIEMNQALQYNEGLGNADPTKEADVLAALNGHDKLVVREDLDGDGDTDVLTYLGDEHVVIGGTNEADTITGGLGDDTIWGEDGDDRIDGGYGVDHLLGGAGDDIITDSGTDIGAGEVIDGEDGDDVINGGMGLDLIFGSEGNDVITGGEDAKDIFGGAGDDFIRAPTGGGAIFGNEGDDWLESQGMMNTLTGDNSELFFNSTIVGHDVMIAGENDTDFDGESGDDIMVQGIGVNRNNGMAGFDWVSYQGNNYDVNADMNIGIFVNQQANILRDRFDLVEGLSGWVGDDILTGREVVNGAADVAGNAAQVGANAPIESFSNTLLEKNIDRIAGLRELVAHLQRFDVTHPDGTTNETLVGVMDTSDGSDIILGGGGSDTIRGRSGNDIIDGDKWLSVSLAVSAPDGSLMGRAISLAGQVIGTDGSVLFGGRTLDQLLFAREVVPAQLSALREIVDGGQDGDVDIVEYWDIQENYTITENGDGSLTVTHNTATAGVIDPTTGRELENEGTDRLTNVEILRFADGDWIVPQGEPPEATADRVILGRTGTYNLADALLLANDVDPDNLGLSITGVDSNSNGLNVGHNGSTTTINKTNNGTGNFDYTVANSAGEAQGNVVVSVDTTGTLSGTNGNDIILVGNTGRNVDAGGGNDTVIGGNGNDNFIWFVGDGRDIINGGGNGGAGDRFTVNGNNSNEQFYIMPRSTFLAFFPTATLAAGTEIVITRNGINANAVIAELQNIEEITINTGPGFDLVIPIGDFSPTSLNFNTITINGSSDDDTVDVGLLDSAHRIVFRGEGGNDMIVGGMRPQDVILLPEGSDAAAFVRTVDENGLVTLSDGVNSIRYTESGGQPRLAVDGTPEAAQLELLGTLDEETGELLTGEQPGAYELTPEDIAALEAMVRGVMPNAPQGDDDDEDDNGVDVPVVGVRDLTGRDNNETNAGWGAAGEAYIRLTDARYGMVDEETGNRLVNPMFEGLDARDISNLLGKQAEGTATETDANMFFMAFGQYFDHGLTFIEKNAANGTIEIGGPGSLRSPTSDNPADLTRAEVVGYDEYGNPVHNNITSPFVDQNQVYGSSSLIGQLLRESDGEGGVGMRVLLGEDDPSAPGHQLLSTLREALDHHIEAGTVFRGTDMGDVTLLEYYPDLVVNGSYNPLVVAELSTDFMGQGWPLLIDTNPYMSLLDHYIGGDGRVNENVGLTSLHTIWARNHNFHVEKLIDAGFEGTQEDLFQAAKILNETEYQRVVFNEFADKLLGGMMGDGTHGHSEYNPDVDARISYEFAGSAYRVGHTMIGQTLTILDENGQPRDVPLYDVFLNPTNDPMAFAMDPDGAGPAPMLTGQDALDALSAYGYAPQPGYAQYGTAQILGGLAGQASEAIDVAMTDAVRNDLVRINADLFSFNVARGWDLGIGTMNQVRAALSASDNPYVSEAVGFAGDLSPYTSWEDYQERNDVSDELIARFKEAYPDLILQGESIGIFMAANPDVPFLINEDGTVTIKGIDRVDLWVGGLAEKRINGGVVGQTFWVIIHEQFDRLQEGDRFYYAERMDNVPVYENFLEGQSLADIVMRNTGIQGLQEDVFSQDMEDAGIILPVIEVDADDIPGTGEETGGEETPTDETPDEETPTEETGGEETGGEETGGEETGGEETGGEETPTETATAQVLLGTDGNDVLTGGAGDDLIRGGEGRDTLEGGEGDDLILGEGGDDALVGGAGDDMLDGGDGSDALFGGLGNDRFFLSDDATIDFVFGGEGTDTLDITAVNIGARVDLSAPDVGTLTIGDTVDRLVSIENVAAGSGDDVIIAGDAANTFSGGEGNDTYRFNSETAADGDHILDFEPGDTIDLSGIDAVRGVVGNQSFTLAAQGASPAAGLVTLSETEDGATLVQGHVDDDGEADFSLTVNSRHTLGAGDFTF
ncbi:peroxidase family protein [Maritimibacter sp. DP1N21-5]|uniref:peroxidase family protein n=1 Tax=Maritimibacter sp. DP1N21-5 TaxID=2836867 RepID=UPI001C43F919|nr:peroxidase family protein [Maritimibacter sp. DP1N21-5]MBV7407546.1 hypothetical protein [Maritimibacter sp. DP1N21-5]